MIRSVVSALSTNLAAVAVLVRRGVEISSRWPLIARIQPFSEQTTVTGSFSIIACSRSSVDLGRFGEIGAALAELGLLPELLLDLPDLVGDLLPLLRRRI